MLDEQVYDKDRQYRKAATASTINSTTHGHHARAGEGRGTGRSEAGSAVGVPHR